jgi:hypothetical protein
MSNQPVKSQKYSFNNDGSPVRKVTKNASNDSFEEIRRAPKKDFSNIPEDRRLAYE